MGGHGSAPAQAVGRLEVLEADLAPSHQAVGVVVQLDQPQLLEPAPVDGRGPDGDGAVRTARRKSVWLATPTTLPPVPLERSQVPAPTLAAVSTAVAQTPPWTMP